MATKRSPWCCALVLIQGPINHHRLLRYMWVAEKAVAVDVGSRRTMGEFLTAHFCCLMFAELQDDPFVRDYTLR